MADARERAATHPRVLPLGVLPHKEHVDVGGETTRQRSRYTGQQPRGTQIGPEIEGLPNRERLSPERDMVGHRRPAAGAHENGVVGAKDGGPLGRHHRSMLGVVVRAPR